MNPSLHLGTCSIENTRMKGKKESDTGVTIFVRRLPSQSNGNVRCIAVDSYNTAGIVRNVWSSNDVICMDLNGGSTDGS